MSSPRPSAAYMSRTPRFPQPKPDTETAAMHCGPDDHIKKAKRSGPSAVLRSSSPRFREEKSASPGPGRYNTSSYYSMASRAEEARAHSPVRSSSPRRTASPAQKRANTPSEVNARASSPFSLFLQQRSEALAGKSASVGSPTRSRSGSAIFSSTTSRFPNPKLFPRDQTSTEGRPQSPSARISSPKAIHASSPKSPRPLTPTRKRVESSTFRSSTPRFKEDRPSSPASTQYNVSKYFEMGKKDFPMNLDGARRANSPLRNREVRAASPRTKSSGVANPDRESLGNLLLSTPSGKSPTSSKSPSPLVRSASSSLYANTPSRYMQASKTPPAISAISQSPRSQSPRAFGASSPRFAALPKAASPVQSESPTQSSFAESMLYRKQIERRSSVKGSSGFASSSPRFEKIKSSTPPPGKYMSMDSLPSDFPASPTSAISSAKKETMVARSSSPQRSASFASATPRFDDPGKSSHVAPGAYEASKSEFGPTRARSGSAWSKSGSPRAVSITQRASIGHGIQYHEH